MMLRDAQHGPPQGQVEIEANSSFEAMGCEPRHDFRSTGLVAFFDRGQRGAVLGPEMDVADMEQARCHRVPFERRGGPNARGVRGPISSR